MTMKEKIAKAIVDGLLASGPGAFINELEANEFSPAQTTIDGHFVLSDVAGAVLAALREYQFTDAEVEKAAEIHGNSPWSASDDSVYTSLFRALIDGASAGS